MTRASTWVGSRCPALGRILLRQGMATVVLCAVWLASAPPAQAGINVWTSNGPDGPNVGALAIDPTVPATLYAGTTHAVFKSTDAGGTWSATALVDKSIWALAVDPGSPMTVYAGTYSNGIYKSTDGGGTWSATGLDPASGSVRAVAIDPTTRTTLYAGMSHGAFKSTDAGSTWRATGNSGDVWSLVIDSATPAILYAAGSGVLKTSDGGDTWAAVNTGLPNTVMTALAIDPFAPETLYVTGTFSGGVFKTTNGGGNWVAVNSGLTTPYVNVLALSIDPTTPDTLYAGTLFAGVFKSTNGASTWSAVNTDLNTDTVVRAIAIDPMNPTRVYLGTRDDGVIKSYDGGGRWGATDLSPRVCTLAINPRDPTTLYAAAQYPGVFKSTDSGNSWSGSVLSAATTYALAIDPVTPTSLYAGTDSNGIYKTTDAGSTWVSVGPNDITVWEIAIDRTTPTTLYAATDSGVFKSTNTGASWDPSALMNTPLQALAIDPTAPTTLYAGGAGVFKSTDGGGTWRSTGLMGDETVAVSVYELAIDPITPATLYAGVSVSSCSPFGCGRGGRYLGKTTDGGDTWTVTPGPTYVPALAIDPTAPMTLYAGGAGVSKSTDGGSTWSALNTGLINVDVRALAIDPITPRRVYAATADGVFAIEQVSVCRGDCAVDGSVTVNEVMTLVNIALGTTSMDGCGSGDANGDGSITIDEIIAAVHAALTGCVVEVEEASVADLQAAMDAGRAKALDLVEEYLARIESLDRSGPTLRSVIEINRDARSIAQALDVERYEHGSRGPLHGIPVLLKDNIDTGDQMLTTAGSLALIGAPAARDATVAERLRDAGAVLLGKTNLSEWANMRSLRAASGWSARGGQTLNPYVVDHSPCGSSSGSAVAVAANLAAVAIGTETDGSVVCPAAANGVVGLKPTVGLTSRAGVIPLAHTQDSVGVLARTVADAATVLGALVGVDPRDPATEASAGHFPDNYTQFLDTTGLRNARIGIPRQVFFENDAESDAIAEQAIGALRGAGATLIDPADVPTAAAFASDASGFRLLLYEFKADLNSYLATRNGIDVATLADLIAFNTAHADTELALFGQEIFNLANPLGSLESPTYLSALEKSLRLSREEGIDAVMDQYQLDALIAPTGPPAWVIDYVTGDPLLPYPLHSVAARAGYPVITVPAGFVDGLPVGVSFVGRAFSEATLIRLAYAFEQATHARRVPKFLPHQGSAALADHGRNL